MFDCPVGVGEPVERSGGGSETQADVFSTMQIAEHEFGVRVKIVGRFTHCAAEHAYGIGNVRASICSTVDESTNKTLILAYELRFKTQGRPT